VKVLEDVKHSLYVSQRKVCNLKVILMLVNLKYDFIGF
jgi:hypothetical protein